MAAEKPQPYTIKISKQVGEAEIVEVVFAEKNDAEAIRRIHLICDTLWERMALHNNRVLALNEGRNGADSARPTHVQADP